MRIWATQHVDLLAAGPEAQLTPTLNCLGNNGPPDTNPETGSELLAGGGIEQLNSNGNRISSRPGEAQLSERDNQHLLSPAHSRRTAPMAPSFVCDHVFLLLILVTLMPRFFSSTAGG
jgi:hypothetical protein